MRRSAMVTGALVTLTAVVAGTGAWLMPGAARAVDGGGLDPWPGRPAPSSALPSSAPPSAVPSLRAASPSPSASSLPAPSLSPSIAPSPSPTASAAPVTPAFGNAGFEDESPAACFSSSDDGLALVPDAHSGDTAGHVSTGGGAELRTDCAPPAEARTRYRVGFWYRADAPITVSSALAKDLTFPAAGEWTEASWLTDPAPDVPGTTLSISITMPSEGSYFFDDLTVEVPQPTGGVAQVPPTRAAAPTRVPQPAAGHTISPAPPSPAPSVSPTPTPTRTLATLRPAPRSSAVLVPFMPPDPNPLNALKAGRPGTELAGPPKWLGVAGLALVLVIALGAVALLDRRFRILHLRTTRHFGAKHD